MEIIVISPEADYIHETDWVNYFFSLGLPRFHIRKPKQTEEECSAYIEQINPEYRNRLVLHQYHNLAVTHKLGGVHYPTWLRKSLTGPELKKISTEWKSVGLSSSTSWHMGDDFSASLFFDYGFYSPVSDSISKPGYGGLPLEQLEEDMRKIKSAVYALGGIRPSLVQSEFMSAFHGVAVLGWIWNEGKSPLEQYLEIANACRPIAHL